MKPKQGERKNKFVINLFENPVTTNAGEKAFNV